FACFLRCASARGLAGCGASERPQKDPRMTEQSQPRRQWTVDDDPIPSCFFASVSRVMRSRWLLPDFCGYWWGHSFVDAAPPDRDGIVLSAIEPGSDIYGQPDASHLYRALRCHYPISIRVTAFEDPWAYLQSVEAEVQDAGLVLVPFPLCRK